MSANEIEQVSQYTTYSPDDLRDLESFDDFLNKALEDGMPRANAEDVWGDGFQQIDKEELIGVPFVIVSWTFSKSKKFSNAEFVTVRVVTQDNRKLFFTDGSTGIYKQLKNIPQPGVLLCEYGLRKSEYDYKDEKGKVTRARTYYFAGNAS